MSLRGVKPKPTALKLINGNPSGRPIYNSEPRPEPGCVKPEFLNGGTASKLWDKYASKLERLGLLTEIDAETFAAFCLVMAKMHDDPEDMKAHDFQQLRSFSQLFGMDPSSRARMRTDNEGKAQKTTVSLFRSNN